MSTVLSFLGDRHRIVDHLLGLQQAFVVGVFYWLPAAYILLMKKFRSNARRSMLTLALLLAIFVPVRRWKAFQESPLWDRLLAYFQVQVRGIVPTNVDIGAQPGALGAARNILYAVTPHGIVPYSLGLTAYGSLGKLLHYPAMACASVIKYIPIFSHMLFWGGAVDATTDGIRSVLSGEYTGYSSTELSGSGPPAVAITPGGIAEMFWSYPRSGCLPDEEYALLRDRKGFVRIALQCGVKLVPIFAFGASQIFRRVALPDIFERLSRWLRTSLLVFYGKFGLPIPFQVPILFALGDAVNLTATAAPSSEEVDFVSNIFIRELERTFESNKRFYGWEHKSLRVV
jgi:hypothetical protein